MKDNKEILSEFFYNNIHSHFFKECYILKKELKDDLKRLFLYKLECSDAKFRYTIYAYEEINKICKQHDWSKSIYLVDSERLMLSFYLESYLVLSRACVDLAISAYYCYFKESKNLDSLNDFIKKIKKESDWLPLISKCFWEDLINKHNEKEYNHLKAFLGSDNGVALRDKVVHKGNIYITETPVEGTNQEVLSIILNNQYYHNLIPWMIDTHSLITSIILQIKNDIIHVDSGEKDMLIKLLNEK